MINNKKILVTGAAGFIGSKTAEKLLELGNDVICLDNFNDYYDPKLKDYRKKELLKKFPDTEFINEDIENYDFLKELFEKHKFDIVVNLAARAGVRYSIENPRLYLRTNTEGFLNILELCKELKVEKLLLASTSSAYAGAELPFTEELPVNEPISPYAATKRAAELMAYTYHHLYYMNIAIMRYFTVYGPAGRPDMANLNFIYKIYKKIPLTLYGDGEQGRDFTYIDDIVSGTIKALDISGYNIINLGGGNNPVKINYMINKIEEFIGNKAIIDHKPFQKADMMFTYADITKAEKLLNWKPEIDFDLGLEKTCKWFMNNLDLIEKLKM